MTDTKRWRYGDTNPVIVPVLAETMIEIGDLVYQDVDNAKPADHAGRGCVWDTDVTTSQKAFRELFLGVALQRSWFGETDEIRVATTGVFEFGTYAETYELGDMVAVAQTYGSYSLANQHVAEASRDRAIGRVARRNGTSDCTVLVDIRSTVMGR